MIRPKSNLPADSRDPRRLGVKQSKFIPGQLDKGIERAVRILREHGIEPCQSCEGGEGHAFPEPIVQFYGTPEAGWRAFSVCLAHGLPVLSLRRTWDVLDHNELTGPHWEITFRERIC